MLADFDEESAWGRACRPLRPLWSGRRSSAVGEASHKPELCYGTPAAFLVHAEAAERYRRNLARARAVPCGEQAHDVSFGSTVDSNGILTFWVNGKKRLARGSRTWNTLSWRTRANRPTLAPRSPGRSMVSQFDDLVRPSAIARSLAFPQFTSSLHHHQRARHRVRPRLRVGRGRGLPVDEVLAASPSIVSPSASAETLSSWIPPRTTSTSWRTLSRLVVSPSLTGRQASQTLIRPTLIGHDIPLGSPAHEVGALSAVERVFPSLAKEHVVARAADQIIRTISTNEEECAAVTVEPVVPLATVDCVGAGTALEPVGPAFTLHPVTAAPRPTHCRRRSPPASHRHRAPPPSCRCRPRHASCRRRDRSFRPRACRLLHDPRWCLLHHGPSMQSAALDPNQRVVVRAAVHAFGAR